METQVVIQTYEQNELGRRIKGQTKGDRHAVIENGKNKRQKDRLMECMVVEGQKDKPTDTRIG